MNKLFSIIIPTRNRQKYCIKATASILKILDSRCELVIQDNSSNDDLRFHFERLDDNRVVYNYNASPLSFVDNFEEAIEISTGRYFCILGDDDTITKDLIKIVEWMDNYKIDSVSPTRVVDFIWPNDSIKKYAGGELSIPKYEGEVRRIEVQEMLQSLLHAGFLSYQSFNLPRTYHGIVRRSCMDEVKRKGGRYFGGLTPDIYSTIALSCVVKNHYVIDFPFSIAGACPASATAIATVGGHSGLLSDAPHFKNRGKYVWELDIPRYYSVETIWAESAIKAIRDMGATDILKHFNRYRLYLYGIFINRKYIFNLAVKETFLLYKPLQISFIEHFLKFFRELLQTVIRVSLKKFKGNQVVNDTLVLKNVYSLEEVGQILSTKVITDLKLKTL